MNQPVQVLQCDLPLIAMERAHAFLAARSSGQPGPLNRLLKNRPVAIFLTLFLIWQVGRQLHYAFVSRDFSALAHPISLFFLIVCGWIFYQQLRQLMSYFATRYGSRSAQHQDLEGISWGRQAIDFGPEGFTVRLDKVTTNYKWQAVIGIEETQEALLLLLAPSLTVIIPFCSFKSEDAYLEFRDFVEAHVHVDNGGE